MATPRQRPESWFGRIANEVYLGAVVLGVVVVVAGIVAALVMVTMRLSNWVAMAD